MALHLIKICVGVDSVGELADWIASRAAKGGPSHLTRQTPRRAAEILDGGSLYWVIKGVVQCRQQVLGLEAGQKGGAPCCRIVLSPELVRTGPALRRPFQGWRYLEAKDAPPDISGNESQGLPPELEKKLIEIGAW